MSVSDRKIKYGKLIHESISVTVLGMNKRHFQQTSFINKGSVMLYISNIFVFIIFSSVFFAQTNTLQHSQYQIFLYIV